MSKKIWVFFITFSFFVFSNVLADEATKLCGAVAASQSENAYRIGRVHYIRSQLDPNRPNYESHLKMNADTLEINDQKEYEVQRILEEDLGRDPENRLFLMARTGMYKFAKILGQLHPNRDKNTYERMLYEECYPIAVKAVNAGNKAYDESLRRSAERDRLDRLTELLERQQQERSRQIGELIRGPQTPKTTTCSTVKNGNAWQTVCQ